MSDYNDISNKKKKAYLYAFIATFIVAALYFICTRNTAYRFGGVKEEVSSISDYFSKEQMNMPKVPENILDKEKINTLKN